MSEIKELRARIEALEKIVNDELDLRTKLSEDLGLLKKKAAGKSKAMQKAEPVILTINGTVYKCDQLKIRAQLKSRFVEGPSAEVLQDEEIAAELLETYPHIFVTVAKVTDPPPHKGTEGKDAKKNEEEE